jgi:transcriptional regulator with XRE-family HTH domain
MTRDCLAGAAPPTFWSRFTSAGYVPKNTGESILKNTESSEETIRRVLSSYDIGPKLRRLRLRKKIALVDLGKHTGLSASMLSQLENGKLVPTLPTLARIAMVFDVGLEHFFGVKKRLFSIVRSGERLQFPELPESAFPGYFFEVLVFGSMEKTMSAYIAEFPARDPTEIHEHFHDGSEFVHILEGTLTINYQSEEQVLGAGDSAYFDGSEPHSYRGLSETVTRAIIITVPLRL